MSENANLKSGEVIGESAGTIKATGDNITFNQGSCPA
jgi:hypothetical protein